MSSLNLFVAQKRLARRAVLTKIFVSATLLIASQNLMAACVPGQGFFGGKNFSDCMSEKRSRQGSHFGVQPDPPQPSQQQATQQQLQQSLFNQGCTLPSRILGSPNDFFTVNARACHQLKGL